MKKIIFCTAVLGLCSALASANSTDYHIVFPQRAIAAGDRVQLRLVPPAPDSVEVRWSVTSGTSGSGLDRGIYRAPYIIPAGTPPAQVTASLSGRGVRISVTAEMELMPSGLPWADDCLGPGQKFSTVIAGLEPEYTYADTLPDLIHRVDPEYPRSAFVRGLGDTIPIVVLVCRSGHVFDAYSPLNYRFGTRDEQPIAHDPKLVEAALKAAMQYVFKPAVGAGHPIAVWVSLIIPFRP